MTLSEKPIVLYLSKTDIYNEEDEETEEATAEATPTEEATTE